MTPGEVRVTVARMCASCDGDGLWHVHYHNGTEAFVQIQRDCMCPTCHGDGVVWEPVTCAGCTHWAQDDSVCQLFTRVGWVDADQERETPLRPWCTCDDLDIPKQNQIVYADAGFACAAWEPREPRS